MLKEKLLAQARLLKLDVYLDYSGKWIIQAKNAQKNCLLKEEHLNRWIVISEEISVMILNLEEAINFLKIFSQI